MNKFMGFLSRLGENVGRFLAAWHRPGARATLEIPAEASVALSSARSAAALMAEIPTRGGGAATPGRGSEKIAAGSRSR
jgi:hypothetical protein